MLQTPHVLLTFDKVHDPLRLPREATSEFPKSGPNPWCFVHFDFEMCFAPQRRALFLHLNFQKCSDHGVFCTFWLRNVLRATTACTFSTSQLPKVVRQWCALYILTCKCASRPTFSTSQLPKVVRTPSVLHVLTCKCASRRNGVQFFISHLASWLRTRRFSKPTFRPSGAPNHWKNSGSRLSYLFSHLHLLSSYSFSSTLLSLIFLFSLPLLPFSAFHLPILSEVWLLNFLRWCAGLVSYSNYMQLLFISGRWLSTLNCWLLRCHSTILWSSTTSLSQDVRDAWFCRVCLSCHYLDCHGAGRPGGQACQGPTVGI